MQRYLGLLLAMRNLQVDVPILRAAHFEWTISSTVIDTSNDPPVEFAFALFSYANVLGIKGEKDARDQEFKWAKSYFGDAAAALRLLAAWAKRHRSAVMDKIFSSRDCEARAAIFDCFIIQCDFVDSIVQQNPESVWLPIGFDLVRTYSTLARDHQADWPEWAVLFATQHASYWLMHCAYLAFRQSAVRHGPIGERPLEALTQQEQMLRLAKRCAHECVIGLMDHVKEVSDECGRIESECTTTLTPIRSERFRNSLLFDVSTAFDLEPLVWPPLLHIANNEARTLESRRVLDGMHQKMIAEMNLVLHTHTHPLSAYRNPSPSLTSNSPTLNVDSIMGSASSNKNWTTREQALVVLGSLIERQRMLQLDRFATPEEQTQVTTAIGLVSHLILSIPITPTLSPPTT
jgi:hypothetical protein